MGSSTMLAARVCTETSGLSASSTGDTENCATRVETTSSRMGCHHSAARSEKRFSIAPCAQRKMGSTMVINPRQARKESWKPVFHNSMGLPASMMAATTTRLCSGRLLRPK